MPSPPEWGRAFSSRRWSRDWPPAGICCRTPARRRPPRPQPLCHVGYAYEQIHFPEGEEALSIARRRLVFEELFLLAAGLRQLREHRNAAAAVPFRDTDAAPLLARLPFSLTAPSAGPSATSPGTWPPAG